MSSRDSELESPQRTVSLLPQRTLTLTPRHSEAPAPAATDEPNSRPPPPKGAGALPAGWSVARDPEGYPYYYNLTTGENTYDRPGGVPPPPPPKAKPPPPPADMVEGRAASSAALEADPAEDEEAAAALWGRCGLSVADTTSTSFYEQGDWDPAAAPEPAKHVPSQTPRRSLDQRFDGGDMLAAEHLPSQASRRSLDQRFDVGDVLATELASEPEAAFEPPPLLVPSLLAPPPLAPPPLAPPPLAASGPDAAPAAELEAVFSVKAAAPSADAPAVASEPADEGRPISPPALNHGASSTFMLLGKMVRSARSLVEVGYDTEGQRAAHERAARKASLRAADGLEVDAYKDATRSRPTRQYRRRKVKASEAVLEGHGCGGGAAPPPTSAACSPTAMDSPLSAAPQGGERRSSPGATLAGARARVRDSVHGMRRSVAERDERMRRSVAGAATGTAERDELKLATREMRENAF